MATLGCYSVINTVLLASYSISPELILDPAGPKLLNQQKIYAQQMDSLAGSQTQLSHEAQLLRRGQAHVLTDTLPENLNIKIPRYRIDSYLLSPMLHNCYSIKVTQ